MAKNTKVQKSKKPEQGKSQKGVASTSKGIVKKADMKNKQVKKPIQPQIQNGKVKQKLIVQNGNASKVDKVKNNKQNVTKKQKKEPQGVGVVVKENKPKVNDKENNEDVSKLTKRNKTRVKAEIKKEIILKGKSTTVLSSPGLVSKKLEKLEKKPEPRSVKVQKKILLFKQLLKRLENAESPKKVKNNKIKPEEKSLESPNTNKKYDFPKNEFVIFVGHLDQSITLNMLRDHFKSAGEVQRVSLPIPKKRKSKRFAYVQFDSEDSRQNGLKLHNTMIGNCKINVLYANKGRNKKIIAKQNHLLNSKRKTELTDTQVMEVGKLLKTKKKTNKKKATKK